MIHTPMFCGTEIYLSIRGNNPCCSVFPRFIVIALQCVMLLKLALFFFSLINRALGIIWGKGRSIWLDKKQWSARLAKIMSSRLTYTFLSTYDNKLFQIPSILILSVLRGNWICSQELFFCKSWKTCLCFFFSCWACLFSLSPLVVIYHALTEWPIKKTLLIGTY